MYTYLHGTESDRKLKADTNHLLKHLLGLSLLVL